MVLVDVLLLWWLLFVLVFIRADGLGCLGGGDGVGFGGGLLGEIRVALFVLGLFLLIFFLRIHTPFFFLLLLILLFNKLSQALI